MNASMVQVSYTPEAWAPQLKDPDNRIEAMRPLIERNCANIILARFAFGDYDQILIDECGDNVSTASSVLVASAAGAVADVKTTVLISVEVGMATIAQAGEVAGVHQLLS